MGIVKEKIKQHLGQNGIQNELQSGFTKGRRIADNLYLLKHCVERTYMLKRTLIVVSIDFQKAFDSVSKGKLIQTLIEAKVDIKLI